MQDPTETQLEYECFECDKPIERVGWCSENCFMAAMM